MNDLDLNDINLENSKSKNNTWDTIFKILNVIKIILIIVFSIFMIINLIKDNGYAGYNDLIKAKFLKEKVFLIDKDNSFAIKKKYIGNEHIKDNIILYENDNIVHFPGMEKNLLQVGDIVFHKGKGFWGHFIRYFSNTTFSNHIGIVRYFIVDKENKLNYNIPDDYYPVLPIFVGAVPIPSRQELDTKFKNYPISNTKFNLKNKNQYVGNISLNYFNNEMKDDMFIIRYKKFKDKIKFFSEIISNYEFSEYRYDYFLEFAPRYFSLNLLNFFQKVFNNNYYEYKNKYFSEIIKNIVKQKNRNKVSFPKIKSLQKITKKLYVVYSITKDENKKKEIMKKIKNLQIILRDIKKNKKFICSEFVYYLYHLCGIDMFRIDRFSINPIQFSNFISPKDIEKVLVKDERFEYICHFKK